jgi:plastocyanin
MTGCTEPEGFGPAPPLPAAPATVSPSLTPTPRTLRVRVPGELSFSPQRLRTGAGETSIIEVANLDDRDHTFVVDELNVLILAGPGQRIRAEVAVHPDLRGTFSFYCRIPGHRAGGMEGRITVR